MEDSETIEALTMEGDPIVTGSVVRYVNTGTVGRVVDIMQDEEGIWVLLDSTGFLYKPEALVMADESELREDMKPRTSVEDAETYIRTYEAENDASFDATNVTGGG
ncbi:DUF2098 domain-containing protein [Methanolobus sp. WCC4]|uniref:DUF2098 domain-containing protein n=1 Tax=Methanolobus sp. WCC4 TaxID=3125784 RepID=UPI0030F93ED5